MKHPAMNKAELEAFRMQILDDHERGIASWRIKKRFNLTDGEFTDIVGKADKTDDAERSEVSGY